MARVRKRKVHWGASNSLGVVGYKLYWAMGKGVNYDSDFADLGNVTEVILPDDVPSFPILVPWSYFLLPVAFVVSQPSWLCFFAGL